MTKKDYVLIAAVLHECKEVQGYNLAVQHVVRCLAAVFKGDNPKFDVTRFLRACGVAREPS